MSKNADEIRSEIEETREAMGGTLEALGDKVAPKKVVSRAKETVAYKVDDVRQKLSPAGAFRRGASKVRDALPSGGERSPSNGNGNGSSRGIELTTGSRSSLKEAPQRLAEKAGSASQSVTGQAAGNPVAMGLLAFGAGLVAAGFLRSSERERQVAERVKARVEPLKDQAREAGKTIVGELKPAAEARVEQVKERTVEAVEQVKGEGKAAAQGLKEDAQTATGQVKQTTKAASGRVRSEAKRSTAAVKGEAKESAKAAKESVKESAKAAKESVKESAKAAKESVRRPKSSGSGRTSATATSRQATAAKPRSPKAATNKPTSGSRSPRRSAPTPTSPAR